MVDRRIADIHNNKKAKKGYKYSSSDGKVYIGLETGRLKLYEPVTAATVQNITNTTVESTGVQSVTGLNTDNTDPANPVVQISVDGVTVTGAGTPASPLVATPSSGGVTSVTDDGNGVVTVDNTIPTAPVVQFQGVNVDGVTITGDGTSGNPLVAAAASGFTYTKTLVNTTPYTIVPTSGYNTYNVDASGGAIVLNFPTAVGNAAWYIVKKIDSSLNTVTLTPNGVETIDGAVNKIIKFQNTSVDVYSDNSNLYLA
jgi:hypothetical protein